MDVIEVQSWRELRDNFDNLWGHGFRGQGSSEWELETSLNRVAKTYGISEKMLWHREHWMLRQFIRRAQPYITPQQSSQDKLEWLALMQHHGAPTRLLDFSHSPYVATFFALENAVGTSAVWCINRRRVHSENSILFEWDFGKLNIDQLNTLSVAKANEIVDLNVTDPPLSLIHI